MTRGNRSDDIDREVTSHLDLEAEEQREGGLSAEEAHHAARRAFGNTTVVTEDVREVWTRPRFERLLQDLRYGVRLLRRTPALSAAAVLTLALGLGGSVATFSVIEAVLLRALPYPDPEQLVLIDGARFEPRPPTLDVQRELRESDVLTAAAVYASAAVNLGGDDVPDRVRATQVSARFFDVLNVPPILGQPAGPDVGMDTATISHGLWQRRFESRSDALGRTLLLNGRRYTIAGVMPREFQYPDRTEVWIPATFRDNPFTGTMVFRYLGRLRPGATLPAAQMEISALNASPREGGGPPARPLLLKPLHAELVKSIRPTLWLLAAAVGCVFLIGCVNVSNLLLARGAARHREMSLRAALGASRARLVRQMLTESAVIAGLAGGVGLAIGWLTLKWLVAQVPGDVPLEGVTVNTTVMGLGAALSALALFLFGLMPALTTAQVDVQQALRETSGGIGGRRSRLLNLLVISEVALATILLTTAGLLARSFANVAAIDTGFEPSQALTFDVSLTKPRYQTPEQRAVFLTTSAPD